MLSARAEKTMNHPGHKGSLRLRGQGGFLFLPLLSLLLLFLLAVGGCEKRANRIVVGSKNFSENLILGEMFAQMIEARTHLLVERRFYLAGTFICQQAILGGRIDIYPEYTGTALTAVLKQPPSGDKQEVYREVKERYESKFGLSVAPALGFDDSFAMVIRGDDARRFHLETLSEAARFTPQWRAGFGYEFMERPDGYKGLVASYGLRFAGPPRIMDLGLITRALKDHQVDIIAGNNTDGLIPALDLFVLLDDHHYFPPYEAVAVMREEMLKQHPEVGAALDALAGEISDEDMRRLNFSVDGEHRDAAAVVKEFLEQRRLIN
jgi:osmoprotectant transport system substrate-binding protein